MEPHNVDHLGGLVKGYNNGYLQPRVGVHAQTRPGAVRPYTFDSAAVRIGSDLFNDTCGDTRKTTKTWVVFSPGSRLADYVTFSFYEPIQHAIPSFVQNDHQAYGCFSYALPLLCCRPARYYCKLPWTSVAGESLCTNPLVLRILRICNIFRRE